MIVLLLELFNFWISFESFNEEAEEEGESCLIDGKPQQGSQGWARRGRFHIGDPRRLYFYWNCAVLLDLCLFAPMVMITS